ncbi:MAG: hypothetical protein HY287_18295 [Planctomycetes bacterium]|nr:hypothetical protein [Planctomycetota bacterium]MBI3836273.1 hypothetical protein [Planctomycetota bacterium]
MIADDGDVDALGAELGCTGLAKSVGVDTFVDAGAGGKAFHQYPHLGFGHWLAAKSAEQRMTSAQFQL